MKMMNFALKNIKTYKKSFIFNERNTGGLCMQIKGFMAKFKKDFNYICALGIIFAAIGWVVENIACLVSRGWMDNRFHILPFIPCYGFVSFAVYIIGNPDDERFFGYKLTHSKVWSNIIYIILIACGVTFGELAVGNLYEMISGAQLWNYNDIPLHWTQYTSLPTTIGFTTGAYLIFKFLYYPLFNMLKERFSRKQARGAAIFFGILMLDMINQMVVTNIKGVGPVYWRLNLRDGSVSFPMLLDFIIFGIFNAYLIMFVIINGRYFNKEKITIPVKSDKASFAVLIPIEKDLCYIKDALESIKKADYPMGKIDLYIASKNINELKMSLNNYKGLCYIPLDEEDTSTALAIGKMTDHILYSGKEYHALIILQDDNIVDRDFFLRMSDAILEGYDIVSGNKDNRNWNDSSVSASAGLVYLYNNHINNMKSKIAESVRLSESGYAINFDLIKKIGKWPFYSKTEDDEITSYASEHKLSTCYQHNAIFYDINPAKMADFIAEKTSRFQSLLANFKKSKKKDLANIVTYGLIIHFLFFIIYNMLLTILGFFTPIDSRRTFGYVLIALIAYYVIVFLYSLVILILDKRKTISAKGILKQALFHPIFLFAYVISFIKALSMNRKNKKNN